MKQTQHTPAPWEYSLYSEDAETIEKYRKHGVEPTLKLTNEGQAVIMSGDQRIALVDCHAEYKRGHGHKTICPIREANARLMAAAPDLLEALEDMLKMPDDCAIERAQAAIAKARGQ